MYIRTKLHDYRIGCPANALNQYATWHCFESPKNWDAGYNLSKLPELLFLLVLRTCILDRIWLCFFLCMSVCF